MNTKLLHLRSDPPVRRWLMPDGRLSGQNEPTPIPSPPKSLSSLARVYWRRAIERIWRAANLFRQPRQHMRGNVPKAGPRVVVHLRCPSVEIITDGPSQAAANSG